MIENTFCHVPGIGHMLECQLWEAGILSWRDALDSDSLPLGPGRADTLKASLDDSVHRLRDGDAAYFYRHIPTAQQWRLFPHFRHTMAYFDIETTGFRARDDYITTIVLYDGAKLQHYVRDDNLDDFGADLDPYDLVVTYNGKSFDAPFVRTCLGAAVDQAHIDLRYVLASLGYRGGLKGCERRLGIAREDAEDLDGYFAVLLWFDYHRNGNERALETLLAYNAMDVVNLESLMVRLQPASRADAFCGHPSASSPTASRDSISHRRRDYRTVEWGAGLGFDPL